jgi:hypothetical protein
MMSAIIKQSLQELTEQIVSKRAINAEEVKALQLHIFSEARIFERILEDGIVDREEAEMLFEINDALSGSNEVDQSWKSLFIDALTSHILKDEISPYRLDEVETQFLISRIERSEKIDPLELELLVNVSASVQTAPQSFHAFVLSALEEAVRQKGAVDEQLATLIRRTIFGLGSSSGRQVDEPEKQFLKKIEESFKDRKNHVSWDILLMELRDSK